MSPETETLLSRRLQALRIDPPDAVGFSLSLRARLEAELAAPRDNVGLSNVRVGNKRVFSRRLGVVLSVAAILVGGSAFALVGPRILEWVGFKQSESPSADSVNEDGETFHNSTHRTRPTPNPFAVPEAPTLEATESAAAPTSLPSTEGSSHGVPSRTPTQSSALKPRSSNSRVEIATPTPAQASAEVAPTEAVETQRVHVPQLSVDLAKTSSPSGSAQPLPELRPIDVPRLDPERPRVVNPDTNQLRDNALRETLRRNRAGKSD